MRKRQKCIFLIEVQVVVWFKANISSWVKMYMKTVELRWMDLMVRLEVGFFFERVDLEDNRAKSSNVLG